MSDTDDIRAHAAKLINRGPKPEARGTALAALSSASPGAPDLGAAADELLSSDLSQDEQIAILTSAIAEADRRAEDDRRRRRALDALAGARSRRAEAEAVEAERQRKAKVEAEYRELCSKIPGFVFDLPENERHLLILHPGAAAGLPIPMTDSQVEAEVAERRRNHHWRRWEERDGGNSIRGEIRTEEAKRREQFFAKVQRLENRAEADDFAREVKARDGFASEHLHKTHSSYFATKRGYLVRGILEAHRNGAPTAPDPRTPGVTVDIVEPESPPFAPPESAKKLSEAGL